MPRLHDTLPDRIGSDQVRSVGPPQTLDCISPFRPFTSFSILRISQLPSFDFPLALGGSGLLSGGVVADSLAPEVDGGGGDARALFGVIG